MRLTFWLRYHTVPGQSLWLTGKQERLGNGRAGEGIPLEYLNGEFWHAACASPVARFELDDAIWTNASMTIGSRIMSAKETVMSSSRLDCARFPLVLVLILSSLSILPFGE